MGSEMSANKTPMAWKKYKMNKTTFGRSFIFDRSVCPRRSPILGFTEFLEIIDNSGGIHAGQTSEMRGFWYFGDFKIKSLSDVRVSFRRRK